MSNNELPELEEFEFEDDELDDSDSSNKKEKKGLLERFSGSDDTPHPSGKKNVRKKGKIGKAIDSANESYDDFEQSLLGIFSPKYYSEVEPEDDDLIFEETKNGDLEVVGVKPRMVKPWFFEYFYTPNYKAQLARFIPVILIFGLFSAGAISIMGNHWISIAVGAITLLLLANILFRYAGVGLYKVPMPRIPLLSNISENLAEAQLVDDTEGNHSGEENEEEGDSINSDTILEKGKEEKKTQPKKEEHPSPASILSNWMDNVADITQADLIEASNGFLDQADIHMLMLNNKRTWNDNKVLDVLSKITGSNPDQWKEAYALWELNTKED